MLFKFCGVRPLDSIYRDWPTVTLKGLDQFWGEHKDGLQSTVRAFVGVEKHANRVPECSTSSVQFRSGAISPQISIELVEILHRLQDFARAFVVALPLFPTILVSLGVLPGL